MATAKNGNKQNLNQKSSPNGQVSMDLDLISIKEEENQIANLSELIHDNSKEVENKDGGKGAIY